jgi:subtilisin family serine protease
MFVSYMMVFLMLFPGAAAANEPASQPAVVDAKVLEEIAAQGETTFWVVLREQADLSPAYSIPNWEARGRFVYNRLRAVANQTQGGIRSHLQKRNAQFTSVWLFNGLRVTGSEALLRELQAMPEVKEILPSQVFEIPEPTPTADPPKVDAVEWGIDRVNAPQVWSTFGVRGEGIVVANIDTGVQFDHPAVVAQYRGNTGSGFDHNFNWFDPSNICGSPSTVPCDNNGHGTHTMGTMVGDDGGANQIGVAPAARWIAAKGCESNNCSDFALLSSAQWILAPCQAGAAPGHPSCDPAKRPHIVNNSWGGGGGDLWYSASVNAWVAAGIFPAFSNGNSGPSCNTSGSPGDYVASYSSGAFDINNNIAGFSSRGPSAFGVSKPNIAAPGVAVRSSIPPNSYGSFNGTSMASPHTAGAVALMWSAAPALLGDIDQTRALLDMTAVDTSDLQCGGTAANNNVWGEGKLDAFAAVSQSPMGDTGAIAGVVTDASSGSPIAGATVVADGPVSRSTTTDASGAYSFNPVPVGTYDVTASMFGYGSASQSAEVLADQTTTVNLALTPAASGSLSGVVRDNFMQPVANATVTIQNTPIPPATTDANGNYSFASVPEGTYNVTASAGACNDPQTLSVNIVGATTQDFDLPLRTDAFGYYCTVEAPDYVEGDTPFGLTGDDSFMQVSLPFSFTFYGETYTSAFVCTNGYLNFLAGNCTFSNIAIPSTGAPNASIYPFWDDLFVDAGIASMWTRLSGDAPNRSFLIEWRNIRPFGDTTRRWDFSVTLHENGQVETQYRNVANDGREMGNSATIGIENHTGTIALQYAFNQAVLNEGQTAIRYRLPPSGFVSGTVTDFNDQLPLAGATVKALLNGSPVRQATTDASGFYHMQLPLGSYEIEASATNYQSESAPVSFAFEDEHVTRDFSLKTARVSVAPSSLNLIVPPGQTRTRYLVLSNSGSLPGTWELNESGGGPVSAGTSAGLEKNPDYDPNSRTTQGLYVGETPAGWSPTAPGDVLSSWAPPGVELGWGLGYDGNVWVSDIPNNNRNHEFSTGGAPTGRNWPASWAGVWPGDMASLSANEMCQVNVGGDNGIYCWDKNSGAVTRSITGAFAWTSISQRGLAYRPDNDSFYIGGWNQGIVYNVAGFSHATPGAILNQCSPPDGNISGLAWNSAVGHVWAATNSPSDTIYRLNPDTCGVISTLPHPAPNFQGGGLEMDAAGNLWMVGQSPNIVYLVESGVPAFSDVPWLSVTPTSGVLPIGGSQQVVVSIDTTGMTPGVYAANLHFSTNSGRQPNLTVPVMLIVPGYQALVNAGGGIYSDAAEDMWAADKMYAAGSWGYVNHSSRPGNTKRNIAGTPDQPLFNTMRQDPHEYRFDGLVEGVYEIRLRFAEISNTRPGVRLSDVMAEGGYIMTAHDIAAEVGTFRADEHVFYIMVTDGQLNLEILSRRGYQPAIINAIGITHRPDR